jgi:hypothetical protein
MVGAYDSEVSAFSLHCAVTREPGILKFENSYSGLVHLAFSHWPLLIESYQARKLCEEQVKISR